jgi:hypothetical protein
LYDLFARIDMPPETFEFRAYTRLKQLQHLLRTRQIDDLFYWTQMKAWVPQEIFPAAHATA